MKSLKYTVIILTLIILLAFSFLFFLGISKTGYINYEYYFKNKSSQSNINDELNLFVNVFGGDTEKHGIFVISKAPYMATITIGLTSEMKENVKIKNIDFVAKNGDIIISLDDCSSVYNSSKDEMVKEKFYDIQKDMYMIFNYEGLNLPDLFCIRISYINGNNIKDRTLLLKKARRLYLTII